MNGELKKVCKDCGVEKEVSLFYVVKGKRGKVYLHSKCIECFKAYRKRYYTINKRIILTKDREYREDNKENIAVRMREYYENNKGIFAVRVKDYYENNKEIFAIRMKEYQKNNRGKCNSLKTARELRKIRATPMWSEKKDIEALYNESARLTRETGIIHHVDHVIPVTHPLVQGLHVLANLRILTADKNISRGNRINLETYDHSLPNHLQP